MKGRIALVTGAGRGIGAAIAEKLAESGAKVAINYNSSKEAAFALLEKMRTRGFEVIAVKADVAEPSQVEAMFEKIEKTWGGVNILVNNAGVGLKKLITDTAVEEWDRVININLKGAFLCSRRALPGMISRRYGRIINIASVWGITGASCESVYAASKGGLIAFTKSLAREAGYSGITVNAIAPGPVQTEMLDSELDREEIAELINDIPAGRLGRAADIAEACLYLASDKAEFINGQVMVVDGGWISV
ncbi:3-oxoacyl-ACP reductase FabG [Thermosyntropha sp.]|uniref:elongation factor P 5-aminopentanone reductase n=1 Tax=Thermosyntropha sp. TaxID=2740820 RepID=UPI0025CE9B82|nr:3-oxoacyl-ACP reductase FabG [Thermosyntropha sp.]MBO8158196.1 3-oxoacyl-ACP reductase FabG [Thermosyntropha sp.]